MNKIFKIAFALVLVFSLVFTANPSDAAAVAGNTINGVSDGIWTANIEHFTEIPMNLVTTPGPDWSQLLSGAIVVPTATKICHPMRGIRFGWVGEIRMLDGNKWIKVPAVVSNAEGLEGVDPIVCANVAAGTFALWGYYDPAKVSPIIGCAYDTSEWTGGYYDEFYFYAQFPPDFPEDVIATYTVLATTGTIDLGGELTDSITTYYAYWDDVVYADFENYPFIFEGNWSATLVISALGCTKTIVIDQSDYYDD